MKSHRTITAATALAWALACFIAPNASATSGHDQPSTAGIIVWTTRAAPGSEHLLIARADGSRQRVLTPVAPDIQDLNAQVSPDGSWIAYERDDHDTATIRLIHPNGTHDHVIDVGCVAPCVVAAQPTWLSNDRIAFSLIKGPFDPDTGNAASAVLWTSHIDGSDVRRLSLPGIDGAYEDNFLHISADRSYLTFLRVRNADGHSALFRMTPTGHDVRQLTPWEISADVNDLSTARHGPTKDLLVFESYGHGDPNATFADIATVPATCTSLPDCTAKIHWLTENHATGRRNANPQWSPDGTDLVFTDRPNITDQNVEIWTMRYLGTDRRKVSNSPAFDYRPTWGVNAAH